MKLKYKISIMFCFLIGMISFSLTSNRVYASPNGTTKVNISLDAGTGFTDNVTLVFEERSSLEECEVILKNANSYNADVLMKQGIYHMKSYKCHGTNTTYLVTFNDFQVESKNEQFVRGNIKLNVDNTETNEGTLVSEHISEQPKETSNQNGSTTRISNEDKYFPGKTFNEVAKWYVDSIKDYLEQGYENKKIEDFIDSVDIWCEMLVKQKSDNVLDLKYNTQVERYDSNAYPKEIYETQYKMYNFIKDYFVREQKYIQFKWTEIDIVQPDVSSGEINVDEIIQSPDTSPTVMPETTIVPSTDEMDEEQDIIEDRNDKDISFKDKIISVIWEAKITILILIVVLIGGVVFKVKYMKED